MKIKIIFTKFLGISLLVSSLILNSCGIISQKSELDDITEYNHTYFRNLLHKNNAEFNAKSATFSGVNLFYNQIDKDSKKNYFLGESSSIRIETLDQFQKIVVNKTVELTKNYPKHLMIPDFQARKEFEEKFLNGKNVEKILEKNNIYLSETGNVRVPDFYRNNYYFEKDESPDNLNIVLLSPFSILGGTEIPLGLANGSPYLKTIVYPKNKKLVFKILSEYAGITKLSDLELVRAARKIYNKLEKKYKLPKNEVGTYSDHFTLDLADFSQKENRIKILKPKVLDLVSKKIDPWNNSFFPEKKIIIKNSQEFKEKILDRILKIDPAAKIDETNLILDFETKFLDSKKLDDILKNNNIFIYETWNQISYNSHNGEIEKLVPRKTENNKIFLSKIIDVDFVLSYVDRRNNPTFDEVAFQVFLFPKDKNIVFEKNVERFELKNDLVKNYYPKYKKYEKILMEINN
ncbi:hypothetical protein [Mesomycoplasma dispar]|uniref:Lipoprotein n=1 Tax=Mesomycoplasma dispar TaxID=86660 RepID=A0ABM6PRL9_9BACT|nr:hypothetical protein [Mesomycoplasma dispar]ATP59758.1 hypothetical protein CSW10_02320 [Mesomycoplasma dispar]